MNKYLVCALALAVGYSTTCKAEGKGVLGESRAVLKSSIEEEWREKFKISNELVQSIKSNERRIILKPTNNKISSFAEHIREKLIPPEFPGLESIVAVKGKGAIQTHVAQAIKGIPNIYVTYGGFVPADDFDVNIEGLNVTDALDQIARNIHCNVSYRKKGNYLNVHVWRMALHAFNASFVNVTQGYKAAVADNSALQGSSAGKAETDLSLTAQDSTPDIWTTAEQELKLILGISQPIPVNETMSDSMKAYYQDRSLVFMTINKRANSLIMRGTYQDLLLVALYLDNVIEAQRKQVRLNIKVLDFALQEGVHTGVNWSRLKADLALPYVTSGVFSNSNIGSNLLKVEGAFNTPYEAVFKALQNQGDVQVIWEPFMVTMNNSPAYFRVGGSTQYIAEVTTTVTNAGTTTGTRLDRINDGLTLQILPSISKDNMVTLHITAKVVSITEDPSVPQGLNTNVQTFKTTESVVSQIIRVKDQGLLVVGGLSKGTRTRNRSGIPFLTKLPIISWFTGSRSKKDEDQEVIFIIQPTVLEPDLYAETILPVASGDIVPEGASENDTPEETAPQEKRGSRRSRR